MNINNNNRKPRACSKTKKNSTKEVIENEMKNETKKKIKSVERKGSKKKIKPDEQLEIDPSTLRKSSRLRIKTDSDNFIENFIEPQAETKKKRQTPSKSGGGRKKVKTVQDDTIITSPEICVDTKVEDPNETYCPISSPIEIDEPKFDVLQQSSDYTMEKELTEDSDNEPKFDVFQQTSDYTEEKELTEDTDNETKFDVLQQISDYTEEKELTENSDNEPKFDVLKQTSDYTEEKELTENTDNEPKFDVLQQISDYTDKKELAEDSDNEYEFSFVDAEKDVDEYLNLINDFEEEKYAPSPFDQTMYNVYYVPTNDGFVEEDRDWDADFDPNFNIEEHLKMKPNKSCLRCKPPSDSSKKILTYKYLDENNQEKYIIHGFSQSTFIKRIITYLKSMRIAFEMEMVQLLIPGINLEARVFGNLQMISDVFREEMMQMLIYSIYNKDSNNYFLTLMEQLEVTIAYFLELSFSGLEHYEFENTKEIFPISDDPNLNIDYTSSVERRDEMIFIENFYLFNAILIYGVFNKHIHFKVLRKMFDILLDSLHKAAVSLMSVD